MTDTRQRAELFAVLRRMEVDTVRMYDQAIPRIDEALKEDLRELRESHEGHVLTLDGLLGACGVSGWEVSEEIAKALEQHVAAVRDAEDGDAVLSRLLEAERTNAAEYAVAEASHLSEDEERALRRLHEEQHRSVQRIEGRLPAGIVAAGGGTRFGYTATETQRGVSPAGGGGATEAETRRGGTPPDTLRGDLTGGVPTPSPHVEGTVIGAESAAGEEPYLPREEGTARIDIAPGGEGREGRSGEEAPEPERRRSEEE